MKPYKAKPELKERLWGGQRLKQYNKSFGTEKIGESWETDKDSMPVLIKLIDAQDLLSIQVHPDEKMAWELERQQNGKNEAWIVLECDEEAELIAGVKNGTDRSSLEEALRKGDILQYLNLIKVKRGDCIYIPAGTVHSLGKGIVVYEVQQPSDLTYRLYDWDRKDDSGRPRQLHISRALSCIDFDSCQMNVQNIYECETGNLQKYIVFQCDYFITSYMSMKRSQQLHYLSNCFTALTCISGGVYICCENSEELMKKGDTWIIPEGCQAKLQADENSELIITEHLQNHEKHISVVTKR